MAFNINPASYNRVCSYNTSVTIVDSAIYLAFIIDKTILNYLILFQLMAIPFKVITYPIIDLQSI